jgi:hypothetical protein
LHVSQREASHGAARQNEPQTLESGQHCPFVQVCPLGQQTLPQILGPEQHCAPEQNSPLGQQTPLQKLAEGQH